MNFEDLTPEQKEKARACKTPEDLLALAKAEGHKLTAEELEAVSGGGCWTLCPGADDTDAEPCYPDC